MQKQVTRVTRPQVVILGEIAYNVQDVLTLAKNAGAAGVNPADLEIGEESGRVVPSLPNHDVSEPIYTQRSGKLVVLLGHQKVAQAKELERSEIKGRFLSTFNLKKAKA